MSVTHPKVRASRLARTTTSLLAATALAAGGVLVTATPASAVTNVVAACAFVDPTHVGVSIDAAPGLLGGLANVGTIQLRDATAGTLLGSRLNVTVLNGLLHFTTPNLPVDSGLTGVNFSISPLLGVLAPITGTATCAALPIQPITGAYQTVTPARILDTRSKVGALKIPANGTITLTAAGTGGVPSAAGRLNSLGLPMPGTAPSAVNINFTVANSTAPGFLTVYPAGKAKPRTSNLNFVAGQEVANSAIVQLGTGGAIRIYNSSVKPVDVIGDVSGYYITGLLTPIVSLTPGAYQPITPVRLLDTRTRGVAGKLKPRSKLTFDATSALGALPAAGVDSVVLNVTATNVAARGHLRVYPDGPALPLTSNLNFDAGLTVANVVTVRPAGNHKVDIFNGSFRSSADVVVDVIGYIAGGVLPAQTPGLQTAVTPLRLLDTRTTTGGLKAQVQPGRTRVVKVIGVGGVPAYARAAVITVTATEEGAPGFATVYPGPTRPGTSILSFVKLRDVANLMIAPINSNGTITIYNGSRKPADLVIDLSAYITGATVSVG